MGYEGSTVRKRVSQVGHPPRVRGAPAQGANSALSLVGWCAGTVINVHPSLRRSLVHPTSSEEFRQGAKETFRELQSL